MISYEWRGLTAYEDSLAFMQNYTGDSLVLGLEHPASITLGKRGAVEKDLKGSWENQNLHIYRVDRGGQATLHSPGQLVIYPLLDLRKFKLRPREYVDLLSSVSLKSLGDLGINVFTRPNFTGIFSDKGKLGAIGVRISKGRTQHGLAINVKNDLGLFQFLRPCGCESQPISSLEKEGHSITPQGLFKQWTQVFNLALGLTPGRPKTNVGADFLRA